MPIEASVLEGKPDGIYEGQFVGGDGAFKAKKLGQDSKIVEVEYHNDSHSK